MRFTQEAVVVFVACSGLGGCAAQSDDFRRMSAEEHERAAMQSTGQKDDHVAEAQRLREAEQAACVEIPNADRDFGPLARKDRIVAVQTLTTRPYPKSMVQPSGAALYVRAWPGMTEQWFDRILECHLAHHAVVGAQLTDRDSPLFVEDARVALSTTQSGFRISITSRDVVAAREVIEKARALVE